MKHTFILPVCGVVQVYLTWQGVKLAIWMEMGMEVVKFGRNGESVCHYLGLVCQQRAVGGLRPIRAWGPAGERWKDFPHIFLNCGISLTSHTGFLPAPQHAPHVALSRSISHIYFRDATTTTYCQPRNRNLLNFSFSLRIPPSMQNCEKDEHHGIS